MKISRPLGLIAALAVAGVGLVHAATPGAQADGGTLTTSNPKITYTHGPFFVPNATDSVSGFPTCGTGTPCDDYTLNVSVPSTVSSTDQIQISLAYPISEAEFDLFVVNSSGAYIASNENGNDPTVVTIPAVSGKYTVRVDPWNPAGQSFTTTISLQSKIAAGGANTAPFYTGLPPRFMNHPIPYSMGGNAGEPSIGVDWKTGNVMYQAGLQTFRVNFDDSISPAKATWTDVSSATTSKTSLDAILFTDHLTGRTFVSQLTGQDSLSAYTDNDGASYTPSQGGGLPSGVDHQSIGGGPYSSSVSIPHPTYNDAVYYCSQDVATAFCARSDDGGLTFGAGVPIYSIATCGGLHGHVKVAPDGTVYVPNKNCGGKTGVAVSTNNGITWTVRTIPDSTAAIGGDPSIGIGTDGTIYEGYQASNGHAMIAVSHDRGITWSKSLDVGAQQGVQNIVFPEVTAGDPNRASFAYIGTTTGGDYQATGTFPGVWYIYDSTTYDGGKSWVTQNVTPNDPVQRGSICTNGTTCGNDRNLLDFMDITTDAHGRVLIAYPDGCVGACITGGPNSFTAYATIARQEGGHGLFAAYDTTQPTVPARPVLANAYRTQANGPVSLNWANPDNGGSPITFYEVYRGVSHGAALSPYANLGTHRYFTDINVQPGVTYYYALAAYNRYGRSSLSPYVIPNLANTRPMCSYPGQIVVVDPTGDQVGAPNNPDMDIQNVGVEEPAGTTDFVFTLKVASLANLSPNRQWRIFWDYADNSGNRYYVGMNTDATGKPTYIYGTEFGQNTGVSGAPGIPSTTYSALPGSGYSTNGTITVVVPKSGVGNEAPGSTLPNVQARTFIGQGNVTVLLTAAATDSTGYSAYGVKGNAYCA